MRPWLALVLLAPAPLQAADQTVAIYYNPGAEMQPRQAQIFAAQLQEEVDKLAGIQAKLLDTGHIGDEKARQTCESERSCLVRLAEAVGSEVLVVARTTTMGSTKAVTLKRLYLPSAEITQAVTRTATGSEGEEFLMLLGPAVAELFPDSRLKDGVERGVSPAALLRWNPPPLQPWVTLSAAGVTGLGGGAAIYFGLKTRQSQNQFNKVARSGDTIDGAVLKQYADDSERNATRTNVCIGLTVALGLGTGILALFTDWGTDADVGVAPAEGGGQMVMSGRF